MPGLQRLACNQDICALKMQDTREPTSFKQN